MQKNKLSFILISILLLVIGCEETTHVDVSEDVQVADQALEDVFEALYSTDPESVEDIDFTSANELYNEALSQNPDDPGANFGAGMTGLLIVTQDSEFNQALEDWSEYVDEEDFFDTEEDSLGKLLRINNNGYRYGLPKSAQAFRVPSMVTILDQLPIKSTPKSFELKRDGSNLELEEIQNLIENEFVSRLSYAIERLAKVVGKGFTFTITPQMMGDIEQDPIVLDDTEFYLTKAFLHSLRSICYTIITYNVNVPYYDWENNEGDFEIFEQNSDFLTIRSGQENSLPNAHADLNSIVSCISSSLDFLENDDDIEYDLILYTDVQELENEMVTEIGHTIQELLDEADSVLNNDTEVTISFEDWEWDDGQESISFYVDYDEYISFGYSYYWGYGYNGPYLENYGDVPDDISLAVDARLTVLMSEYQNIECLTIYCNYEGYALPEEELNTTIYWDVEWVVETEHNVTINISNFLTSPPNNLKELLPGYSVDVGTWYDWDWQNQIAWDSDYISFNITVDESDYYDFDYSKEIDPYGNIDIDSWGNIDVPQNVIDIVDARFDELISQYGSNTYMIRVSIYWNGYLNVGVNNVYDYLYWEVYEVEEYGSGIYPILTWNADTFDEWIGAWPDATFSGLLPGMTAEKLFIEIFEMDEDDWEKTSD